MPDRHTDRLCCGRCAQDRMSSRDARRARYKAAVFPAPAAAPAAPAGRGARGGARTPLRKVACGTALDASPHVLVMAAPDGERTFALLPGVSIWRGRPAEPTDIRPGDKVVVRLAHGRTDVADKLWAGIGRVTGTIVEHDADRLVVDEGATRRRQLVALAATARSRILVRFPQLAPGQLIDVIGVRRAAGLEALLPATAQPPAPGSSPAPRPPESGARDGSLPGAATWHEPAGPGEPDEGLAYPAVDPACGCAEAAAATRTPAAALPFLAVGSMLTVRNECTGAVDTLPVTTCGAVAGLFADRCLECGTSRRSRVADLTLSSFVRLGGELERGCFNATLSIGWAR